MINLTPHEIKIKTDAETFEFPPSGLVARVETIETPSGDHFGIPLVRRRENHNIVGMPDDDKLMADGDLLVSSMVAASQALESWRNERYNRGLDVSVFVPDTGKTAIRDDAGRIVAVTQLVVVR